ncbi:MAG: hypothetical protein IID39_09555, partial [Planctomycetes bacterium]|nr:hypothetical protein [Planctomycetota bacterium]
MGHPTPRITRVGAVIVLWVLLVGGVSHAQPTPTGNLVAGDEATRAGVYLNDSLEAADELARANRLVEAERWNEAAALMLRTAGRFAKHLIRHEAGLYVNVAEYVNRRVADWPAPGLAAYRRLCDSAARLAADTAVAERSLPALLEVTERYFCTTHALRTAEMAAELAIEAGRFDLAADLYGRLLRQHPDRQKQTVALKSKLALVHAWAGRAEPARLLAEQISEASPEHHVQWGQTSR